MKECSFNVRSRITGKALSNVPSNLSTRFTDSPSGRTVALGLTQPLTEMSTGNTSLGGGGVKAEVRRADNLTTFMCRLS